LTQAEGQGVPHAPQALWLREVRLRQDALVERFDDAALVLIVEDNRLITVNLAAAELFEELRTRFGDRIAAPADIRAFLEEEFGLRGSESKAEAEELVVGWLECGLMQAAGAPGRGEDS